MRIADSFLFSEAYEKELLLLKFILEDDGIAEWIIIENTYTFQGEYKGLQARALIENDKRFEKFVSKIIYIEKDFKTPSLPKHQQLDSESYKVEFWQRDLAQNYFLENYKDDDWIMISDVDEMVDFTDKNRAHEFFLHIKNSVEGVLNIPAKRYWYDFDNEYKILFGRPVCTKKYLLTTNKKLHQVRVESYRRKEKKWNNIIGFEYSGCYDMEHILRKFYTSTHTGFTKKDLLQSLRCNARPFHAAHNFSAQKGNKNFFETIVLNESNSPQYVRENINFLKTNNIDPNYKINRIKDYPELFRPSYIFKSAAKNIKLNWKEKWEKKIRFALRNLKMEKLFYK